jgi:hypothetical protein
MTLQASGFAALDAPYWRMLSWGFGACVFVMCLLRSYYGCITERLVFGTAEALHFAE